ncbi:hypothetical protein [Emticicia sp.]|uniref:hypothetical protein n=1 Tax=Emticicia sp. TaxID=1930953 RepID=UPI003751F109
MKKQMILSSIFFLMLTLIACKKGEQGEIGPAGSAGTKGAKGITGDKGIADAKGMVSSNWIDVKGIDWRAATNANSYFVAYTSPGLTADIISKGVLYVFMRTEADINTVSALPFVSASTGRRYYTLVGLSNNIPSIQFYQNVTPPSSTFSTSTNVSFRFVVVPASGARMASIDWTNYEEVKKELNWVD